MENEKDWKVKLRYGKLKTAFQHYSIIAPVIISEYIEEFEAKPGKAYVSMKVWVAHIDDAFEVIEDVGEQTGFKITGKIEVYETEPDSPPDVSPNVYNVKFSYYD